VLASSVAFLGVPNKVDVAEFFIIVSIGLSLGSVVMGFNGGIDEKLSELQYVVPGNAESNKKLIGVAGAMEQHYTFLLLSVLCFFLSLLAFTGYSIYASVFVVPSFTIRYLFFSMAAAGLTITMGIILRWNWKIML